MVSVVVNVYDSQKYLIRCLNSIMRQTYKDTEIIVVANEELERLPKDAEIKVINERGSDKCGTFKKAVDMAHGEYIYFCSSDSMMTDNTLDELVKISNDSSACPYTRAYTPNGSDYTLDRKIYASICGKLFCKEKLQRVITENIQKKLHSELEVVIEYLQQCERVVLAEEAMIYESKEKNLIQIIDVNQRNTSYWKKVLKSVAENCTLAETRNFITTGIGEVIAATENDTEELMFYTERLLHSDVWLNYAIAGKSIRKWWRTIQDGKNSEMYKAFVEYISCYDGEAVAKLLLKDCGISQDIFDIMKVNQQDTFLTILDSIKDEEKGHEGRVVAPAPVHQEKYSYELSGMQLADYVVDKYKSGSLGLKTILKSLKAWIKYKI